MTILRDEHTEVLHSLFTIDKKNANLAKENLELKRLVMQDREDAVAALSEIR